MSSVYQPQGFLPSILNYASLPGDAVMNTIAGRRSAAGNNILDFLLGPAHVVLPESIAPHFTKPEENVSGGDLVGLHEPGALKTLADMGIGAALNPLSYVSFGAGAGVKIAGQTIAGAGKTLDPLTLAGRLADTGATKGADLVDSFLAKRRVAATDRGATPARDALERAKLSVNQTMGWGKIDPLWEDHIKQAHASGQIAAEAGTKHVSKLFAGTTEAEQNAIGDAFDAVDHATGKPIVMTGTTVKDRLAALATANKGLRLPVMEKIAAGLHDLNITQTRNAIKAGALETQPGDNLMESYLHRIVRMPQKLGPDVELPSVSNGFKSRKLDTPEDLQTFLANPANAEVGYERNALRRSMARAADQGQFITQGSIGKAINENMPSTVPWTSLKNSREMANEVIGGIAKADPLTAGRLADTLNGMPGRKGLFLNTLASSNRYLKPAMVFGLGVPKVGSNIRNRAGMIWQILGSDIPASEKWKVATSAIPDLLRSADEAWAPLFSGGGKRRFFNPDSISKDIDAYEHAISASKGDMFAAKEMLKKYDPILESAVSHGVLDGFVRTEDLIKDAATGNNKWTDIIDAPSKWFQGIEQRGRLALYKGLRAKDWSAERAAKEVREAFLDYSVSGVKNRTLRDIIPFAQFMTKSIPQQAKLLSNHPLAATAIAPLFGQDPDHPVSPYMTNQSRVALGKESNGDYAYLTGFGLPTEALNAIPLSGNDVMQNVVGASHPFLKTAAAATFGIDPHFGTPFGSYDKTPITGTHSEFGRNYNMLASTGLLAPIEGPVSMANTIMNDKVSPGARAADLFSGAHIAQVDEDQAMRQIMDQQLRSNPNVKKYTAYFQQGEHDPQVDALLTGLADAKKRAKAKAQAAGAL